MLKAQEFHLLRTNEVTNENECDAYLASIQEYRFLASKSGKISDCYSLFTVYAICQKHKRFRFDQENKLEFLPTLVMISIKRVAAKLKPGRRS